jgi:phasin family protein
MSTKNPFENMKDAWEKMPKMPKIDKEAMMNSHRKNLDALSEANKRAMDVIKSISQLQSQYMKQAFDDFSSAMQDMMKIKGTNEAIEKHSSHVKNHVSKAVEHGKNITTTLAKTQKEIFDIMRNRYKEGMDEFQEMHSKATKH